MGLDLSEASALVALVMLTSFFSGVFGIGGGLLLMIFLSWRLPMPEALFTHAAIQWVANVSRLWIYRSDLRRDLARDYSRGYALGLVPAICLLQVVRLTALKPILYVYGAVTMLLPPHLLQSAIKRLPRLLIPALTPSVGLLIGPTGPLLAPLWLSRVQRPPEFVAADGFGAAINHTVRLVVYSFTGLVVLRWTEVWPLFALLFGAATLGTFLARGVATRLEPRRYFLFVRGLVVVVCLTSLLLWLR